MRLRTSSLLAVMTSGGLLAGTTMHAHAAELGFLEMLFGARPAVQQAQPAQTQAPAFEAVRMAAKRARGSAPPAVAFRPATRRCR